MFTGLIEELGIVKEIQSNTKEGAKIIISAKKVLHDLSSGDSIAVNGVCLTATLIKQDRFTADVMPETFRKTNLSLIKPGEKVNLERALPANGRFGGHIVSGHVDGIGSIKEKKHEGNAVIVTIKTVETIMKYIVEKGSISIDGISLTVAFLNNDSFSVSIIPHTAGETSLITKKTGDTVNLECDIVGKYVEKLILYGNKGDAKGNKKGNKDNLKIEFLAQNGFL